MKLIRRILNTYSGLNRSIYVLFIAIVINRIGGFVYAFLAILLKTKLNYSNENIANYLIIAGVLTSLSPVIGGYLGDRFSRKLVFVFSSFLGASTFIVAGILSNSHIEIIPILIITASFFFNIANPILNAMVADNTYGEEERKKGFSFLYLARNIGVAIGPFIGGRLIGNNLNWFFYLDSFTTFISMILVFFLVKDVKIDRSKEIKEKNALKKNSLYVLFKIPSLLIFLILSLIPTAIYAQSSFGLPLKVDLIFGKIKSPIILGNLMAFNAIIVVLFTMFLTHTMKYFKTLVNVIIGNVLIAVGFGLYAFIHDNMLLYFVSVFIWTLGEIYIFTNNNVYIMSKTPKEYRARFNAIIALLFGAAHILAPKIMSYLMKYMSNENSWLILSATGFISVTGLIILLIYEYRLH